MEKEDYFNNKFRIRSARYPHWDYSQRGFYFVTICAKSMKHYFGEIKSKIMNLSQIGFIVFKNWKSIPSHHPQPQISEFVVMPNHIHGIIEISKGRDALHASQSSTMEYKNVFGSQKGNLSSIIRGFKSSVKSECKKGNIDFEWQPKFYDRIVRDQKELNKIKTYIMENPMRWEFEKNNPENIYS